MTYQFHEIVKYHQVKFRVRKQKIHLICNKNFTYCIIFSPSLLKSGFIHFFDFTLFG